MGEPRASVSSLASLCPVLMAKCTGSVSLPQMLPKSAEHTNCLLQVTERDTDGVMKYQKPVSRCLVTQPSHQAGRSVKAPTPWLAGAWGSRKGHARTLAHRNTHTHAVGVGPKTFKTGKNLKHKTLKNHPPAIFVVAGFQVCLRRMPPSVLELADGRTARPRTPSPRQGAACKPRVTCSDVGCSLQAARGAVALTLTHPTTRARKKCSRQF